MTRQHKPLLLIIGFLFLTLNAFAQVSVSGKVVDENEKPLARATVRLLLSNKPPLTHISDSSGAFLFKLNGQEKMQLKITAVNHQEYESAWFTGAKNFATIVLKPAALALNEVTIKGRQDPIEIRGGNITFHVDRSPTAQGMTALEVLKKMPGVDVDNETSIGLNGKRGVLIYLDGRPTNLSAREVIDLLRAMPSSQLRSIELMNNPGAKFDAEGSAGIIDIRTAKNTLYGVSASVSATVAYGVTAKQLADASLSYRKDKLNIYGGYNHNLGYYNYLYGADRLQAGTRYNSHTDDVDKRQKMNARLGVDYQLSPTTTIGLLSSGNFIFGGGITDTYTAIIDPATGNTLQTLTAINDYYAQQTQRNANNLNYRYEHKSGKLFNIDVDFGRFTKSNANLQNNTYSNAAQVPVNRNMYRTFNDIAINLFGGKVDFATPLQGGKMELGAKYTKVRSANDARFFHALAQTDSMDNRRSNAFAYDEQIAAAYISYGKKINQWSFDAGLRWENTFSNADLSDKYGGAAAENNRRNYGHIFPFVSLSVNPKTGHSWSLTYAKRINRPAYQDLNPFVYLLDELSFWQGNPFLKPQLTHRLALQYGFRSATFINLSFSYTDQFSANVTDTLDQNKVVMVVRNLGKQQNLALNLTQNIKLLPWADLSVSGLVYYLRNDMNAGSYASLNLQQWIGRFNSTATLRLPWALTGEITGSYNTRRLSGGNTLSRANGRMDIGLQKIFNKKATLRLALNDVYKGSKTYSTQNFAGFEYNNYGYFEARQLRLSFTYKLLSGKAEGPRKRELALDKENERTGN